MVRFHINFVKTVLKCTAPSVLTVNPELQQLAHLHFPSEFIVKKFNAMNEGPDKNLIF